MCADAYFEALDGEQDASIAADNPFQQLLSFSLEFHKTRSELNYSMLSAVHFMRKFSIQGRRLQIRHFLLVLKYI